MTAPFKLQVGLNTRIVAVNSDIDLIRGYFVGYIPDKGRINRWLVLAFGFLHPEYQQFEHAQLYFLDWHNNNQSGVLLQHFFLDMQRVNADYNAIYRRFMFYELALGNSALLPVSINTIKRNGNISERIQRLVTNEYVIDFNSVYTNILKIDMESVKLSPIETLICEVIYTIRTEPTKVNDDFLYQKSSLVVNRFNTNPILEPKDESLILAYFNFLLMMNFPRTAAILTNLVHSSYSSDPIYTPAQIYLFTHFMPTGALNCCSSDITRYVVKSLSEIHVVEANILDSKLLIGCRNSGIAYEDVFEQVFYTGRKPELVYRATDDSFLFNEICPSLFDTTTTDRLILTYQRPSEYFGFPILAFTLDVIAEVHLPVEVPDHILNHKFKIKASASTSNQGNLLRENRCYYMMLYAEFIEFTDGRSLNSAISSEKIKFIPQTSTREFKLLEALMTSRKISDAIKDTIRPLYEFMASRRPPSRNEPLLYDTLISYLRM